MFYFKVFKHYFFITYECAKCARMFTSVRPFQPSLMFASEAGFYPSEASTFQVVHLRVSLTHKHQTSLEKPTRNKHSHSFGPFVNYKYTIIMKMLLI